MTTGPTDPAAARPDTTTWVRRLRGASRATKIVWGAAAAAAALAITLVSLAASGSAGPPRARPAKNFTLSALGDPGKKVALVGYAGKPVIVNFFASWCGPCKREAPVLEQVWRQNRSSNVVVLGVDANDARGDAETFVRKHGLTYPVVFDQNGLVAANRYDIANLPVTYVLNPKGRVVGGEILGPVSEAAHSQELFRYLRAAEKS